MLRSLLEKRNRPLYLKRTRKQKGASSRFCSKTEENPVEGPEVRKDRHSKPKGKKRRGDNKKSATCLPSNERKPLMRGSRNKEEAVRRSKEGDRKKPGRVFVGVGSIRGTMPGKKGKRALDRKTGDGVWRGAGRGASAQLARSLHEKRAKPSRLSKRGGVSGESLRKKKEEDGILDHRSQDWGRHAEKKARERI